MYHTLHILWVLHLGVVLSAWIFQCSILYASWISQLKNQKFGKFKILTSNSFKRA